MSAVVKTLTPFVSRELLLEALDALGVLYTCKQDQIVTDRKDYYGHQIFSYSHSSGKYVFQHDSSANVNSRWTPYPWGANFKEWTTVSSFLGSVESEYRKAYIRLEERVEEEKRLELARRLAEEEEKKRQFVEKQKQTILEKAKEKGYSVKETKQGNKTHLVLVRTIY
jgi:hypothetical protein